MKIGASRLSSAQGLAQPWSGLGNGPIFCKCLILALYILWDEQTARQKLYPLSRSLGRIKVARGPGHWRGARPLILILPFSYLIPWNKNMYK